MEKTLAGWAGNPRVFALVMDMGTGKSRVLCHVWWETVTRDEVDDLLIVAPKGCYLNWSHVPQGEDDEPGEFEKWFPPEEYAQLYIRAWVSGAGVRHQKLLSDFVSYTGKKRRVLLMNVEALSAPGAARDLLERYLASRRVAWAVDEAASIMHWDSLRTKFVHGAAKLAARRYVLTGLLTPETPLDVFSQFWFLDWRILGFRDYYAFRRRYAVLERVDYRPVDVREAEERRPKVRATLYYHRQTEKSWQAAKTKSDEPFWLPKKSAARATPRPGGCYEFSISRWLAEEVGLVEWEGRRGVEVVVNYQNQDELRERVAAASYRVEMDAVLDLPPMVYMPMRWVEMAPEQERMYEEMRRFATTVLGDAHATASTKLDQIGKLQALLCGHVVSEDGSTIDVPQNRVTAIMELLQDHSGKAIVWAPYPRFLEKVTEALRTAYGERSTVTFWGATGNAERAEGKRRIQRDDTARFMVANQAVGGEGNTWTTPNLIVYGANGPKNKDRQQSERRTRRPGQTQTVACVDVAVRGTVDEKWVHVIRKKMDLAAALVGDAWREWLV